MSVSRRWKSILFLTAAFSIAGLCYHARAQNDPPPVIVDYSVLEALDPHPQDTQPQQQPAHPMLTGPAQTGENRPFVQNFPITVRETSRETFDPSAGRSTVSPLTPPEQNDHAYTPDFATPAFVPEPVPGIEPQNIKTKQLSQDELVWTRLTMDEPPVQTGPVPPLPGHKPVQLARTPVAAPQPIAALDNVPPIPPRRPDVQQASRVFVAEKRRELIEKGEIVTATNTKRNPDADIKGRVYAIKNGEPMTSAPLPPVTSVALPPLKSQSPPVQDITADDDFVERLLMPDRTELAQTMEEIDVAARVHSGKGNSKKNSIKPARISMQKEEPKRNFLIPPVGEPEEEQTAQETEVALAKAMAELEPASGAALSTKKIETTKVETKIEPDTKNSHVPRPPPQEDNFEKDFVSVSYEPGIAELSNGIEEALNDQILPLLSENPAWRLQIQAFASPADETANSARRTSLSRALAVRTYLLDKGIEPRRMDVRALGAQTDRNPLDRIDLVIFDPAIN